MKGPESSARALVKMSEDVFSNEPLSCMTNFWSPALTRELLRTSVPSRYQRTFEEGTEPILQESVALSPEII